MTLDKVALWHRLREDPDFTEEWLRFLGHTPPTATTPVPYREWGDGMADNRPHVISEMSLAERWIECRCGVTVTAPTHRLLGATWDGHRGLDPQVIASRLVSALVHQESANDDEVGAFLRDLSSSPPDEGVRE